MFKEAGHGDERKVKEFPKLLSDKAFGRIFRAQWRLLHPMLHCQLHDMALKSSWYKKKGGDETRYAKVFVYLQKRLFGVR